MVNEELKKEVAEISLEKNISNLKREQSEYTKNLERLKEDMERLEKEEESVNKRFEVIFKEGNFKIINPTWEYEKDPEYLEAIKIDFNNKHRQDLHLIDQNRVQLNKFKKAQEEALESVTKELERLTGEKNE